jgi:DNA-binding XRE family transcriptional regulator
MARSLLPYTTTNNLADRLIALHAKRISERGGLKINLSEVEGEVAEFCGIGVDSIGMIKRGNNQPSLPVAMKLCRFFNCTVEEMFRYKDIICDTCDTMWDGEDTRLTSKSVTKPVCQKCGNVINT